ncbi:MAG TPA: insulinase family protein, partial [Polyangiaceae bacterium]
MRTLACALAGLLVASPASADTGTESIQRFRLKNGLDVVLQTDTRSAAVAVIMAYDTGMRDEPSGYDQLAHVVEHMTYEGSRHLEANRAIQLLELAGMQEHNGTTSLDGTSYHSLLPAHALPLVLWIESERMAFTLERFDERALSHQRDVVRNELRPRLGPENTFRLHFLRGLYGKDHPYAKSVDPLPDLDAIGIDDARWFFQQGYRPSNAHLVVVGDIDPGRARAHI